MTGAISPCSSFIITKPRLKMENVSTGIRENLIHIPCTARQNLGKILPVSEQHPSTEVVPFRSVPQNTERNGTERNKEESTVVELNWPRNNIRYEIDDVFMIKSKYPLH